MVTIDDLEMRELVLDAWRMVVPKPEADAFEQAQSLVDEDDDLSPGTDDPEAPEADRLDQRRASTSHVPTSVARLRLPSGECNNAGDGTRRVHVPR